MLEEILKGKIEQSLNVTAEIKEDEELKTETSFKDFVAGKGEEAPKEEVQTETKEEVKTETIVAEESKNLEVDNKNEDVASDVFDFSVDTETKEVNKEEVKEESVFDLNTKFKESFPDLEIEDVAQLVNEYKSLKEKKPLLSEEELSKVASLLTDGDLDWNKIKQIAEVKTLDVTALNDRDVFVSGLKREGLTDKEIQIELEMYDSAINFDEEDADKREILENNRYKSSLRNKIKEYRNRTSALKNDAQFDLPKLDLTGLDKDAKAKMEQQALQQKEMIEKWNTAVKTNLNDFKEIAFNLDKDKKYNFKVNEEDLQFVEKSITDSAEIYKRYADKENNSFDFKSMRQDLFMMKNWKSVVKTLIQQNANYKAEEIIKEISNVDFDGSQKSGGTKTVSPRDLGIKAILGI